MALGALEPAGRITKWYPDPETLLVNEKIVPVLVVPLRVNPEIFDDPLAGVDMFMLWAVCPALWFVSCGAK